jgi:hypothetical protein
MTFTAHGAIIASLLVDLSELATVNQLMKLLYDCT